MGLPNKITGDAGNNVIAGSSGADVLDGGLGTDTVNYGGERAGVTVNLSTGTAIDGNGFTDALSGFENVMGTYTDDVITGDAGDNVLSGGFYVLSGGFVISRPDDGNDRIYGMGGNDTLEGGFQDDVVDGGPGTDTANFDAIAPGIHINSPAIVDLNLQGAPQNTGHGMDTLSSIENLTGTMQDDTLIGDSGPNVLQGLGGNDLLTALTEIPQRCSSKFPTPWPA